MIDIAVLASGSGTNVQALIDTPDVKDRIRLVASDRDDAKALERATAAGIETAVIRWRDYPDRDSFSTALADAVEDRGCKGVVLAGFMRILAPSFVDRFPGRILNVHPSLLPAFPGAHAVEDALEHGVKVTGVTVHIVDEEVDQGPIVAQHPVRVKPGDTVESLHTRIRVEEHRLYPEIVAAFIRGEIDQRGRLGGGSR
ncbi:MAG: phosphoribosylglycinamide formyltransferase [Acidimicrobiia bacterium]|nr:phosphoribosylglycinamide formyltransferase [Acidimicrobiia bacterium]